MKFNPESVQFLDIPTTGIQHLNLKVENKATLTESQSWNDFEKHLEWATTDPFGLEAYLGKPEYKEKKVEAYKQWCQNTSNQFNLPKEIENKVYILTIRRMPDDDFVFEFDEKHLPYLELIRTQFELGKPVITIHYD